MSDHRMTIMENIFREMIGVIGQDKALEILNSMLQKLEVTPKAEKKKVEEKPKDEEKKKRIPRMSPTLATQLKTEMGKVGVKINEDDKKEFDKIKKEFVTYVDDLTDDDFTAKGLADHMRDFADSKKPAEKPVEEKVVKTTEKKKAEKKVVKKAEDKPVMTDDVPTNAANIVALTLDELRSVSMLATPGDKAPKGVYWDGGEGRWVRGPESDSDEDLVETTFSGKTYMVGEVTGRIYEETDDRDVFHGFVGVGKFRDMSMP